MTYITRCLLLLLGSSSSDAVVQEMMQRALAVEPAGERVLEGESQWLSCTFDWSTPSHAHLASQQWGGIPGLSDQLKKRRKHQNAAGSSTVTQSVVFERLQKMLAPAAATLNELNVNWYLSEGSAIGFLRNKTFIPWDEDVDIDVKMDDRSRICTFISQGEGAEITSASAEASWPTRIWDFVSQAPDESSAFRLVPGHPELLMVGYLQNGICNKVLWVDIETEVALDIDHWVDSQDPVANSNKFLPTRQALFMNVQVNVPEGIEGIWGIFQEGIEEGIDKHLKQVSMKTSGAGKSAGWSCTAYKCPAVPTLTSSAASLDDLYRTNPSAMHGPFDFQIDASTSHTNAQCSLPRDFSSCSAKKDDLEQVWVNPCESSPWAPQRQSATQAQILSLRSTTPPPRAFAALLLAAATIAAM